ncbi:MAG: hypothetical protein U0R24_11400 [Solirubrobacterales bacterium]
MWVVRLSDKQLEVLKALVNAEERHGPTLARALESLELARWDELPTRNSPGIRSATSPAGRASAKRTSSGTSPARATDRGRCGQTASAA